MCSEGLDSWGARTKPAKHRKHRMTSNPIFNHLSFLIGEAILLVVAFSCVYPGEAPPKPKPKRYEFAQKSMGVEFRIILYSLNPKTSQIAGQRAFQRIQALDQALSNFKNDSELMRLCRLAEPGLPIPVSADLFRVLAISKRLHRLSMGAFEITIGPLSQLWMKSRRTHKLPSQKEIEKAKENVGSTWIRLDHARHTVEFLKKGLRLDLGGIAKGYAVDQALKTLTENGILSALVDGSGDIAVSAPPPQVPGWKIAISPRGGDIDQWIYISHGAIATSGDRFGRVLLGGKRYSHIVDPKTGLGLVNSKAVTVFHRSCTYADALATTLSVLNPEKGIALIRRLGDSGTILYFESQEKKQEPIPLSLLPFIKEVSAESDPKKSAPSPKKGLNKRGAKPRASSGKL
jgi:thiamine biosynthesis lipoprotein